MTIADRFFSFLTLLSIINVERPRLILREEGNVILQIIPFAVFEDLQETLFLMQYANGIRPYVLEWYYDVFLETYNAKTEPDFKVKGNSRDSEKTVIVTEERIAVTTQQLADATHERRKRTISTKQVLDNYINP